MLYNNKKYLFQYNNWVSQDYCFRSFVWHCSDKDTIIIIATENTLLSMVITHFTSSEALQCFSVALGCWPPVTPAALGCWPPATPAALGCWPPATPAALGC